MSKNAKSETSEVVGIPAQTLKHVSLGRLLDFKTDDAEMGNRELNKEWVKELAASIEVSGLDTPLLAWNGGSDAGETVETASGKEIPATFLVAGFHRREALKLIQGKNPTRFKELFPNGIPCYVRGGTLAECIAAQLRENILRRGVEHSDILPQMIRLRDEFDYKAKAIAKAIGKSAAFVSQVFAVEEELGSEVVEEVAKGKVKLQHAKAAAQEVRRDKKAGKTVDKKAVAEKLKAKSKKLKEAGREREERRLSPAKCLERYEAIPASSKLKAGERVLLLEQTLAYLAKRDGVELPDELSVEPETKKSKAADDDEGDE